MQITEEKINMPFKDKLKSLRAKKNITQEQLAEQLHVSRSLIAKWENGRGYPDDETINAMATYFGVDKQYFVEDEDRTKARTMQIVGFAILSAVVLALVASLFTISFLNGNLTTSFNTQYIVITLLGLLLLVLGFINISGNVRFIHRYQRRGVNTENMPKYAIFMGLCNGIIGAGVLFRRAHSEHQIFRRGLVLPLCNYRRGDNNFGVCAVTIRELKKVL